MIGGDPAFYLRWKLGGWGAQGTGFIEPEALAEYERCFCTPEAIHAACEDYRASAGIDLEHDRTSRAQGERIACDLLVLWGARGVVQRLFDPLALWRAQCAGRVDGRALPCGHYLPEEQPEALAAEVDAFFNSAAP
jgi:haloacetate dehalogenase